MLPRPPSIVHCKWHDEKSREPICESLELTQEVCARLDVKQLKSLESSSGIFEAKAIRKLAADLV